LEKKEEKKDLESAAESLKKSLKINGKYPPAMIALGNLLFESGHARTAAKYF
jgi:lipopolysaccharide biosynthesis regulator YciM